MLTPIWASRYTPSPLMSRVPEQAEMHLSRPKRKPTMAMFSGFQLPKIITARARKPKPATSPLAAPLEVVRA